VIPASGGASGPLGAGPVRHAWRRRKLGWLAPENPGPDTPLARAKDAEGRVQTDRHGRNFGGYAINHPLPIEVFVEGRDS
jgi:hypothetical protein